MYEHWIWLDQLGPALAASRDADRAGRQADDEVR